MTCAAREKSARERNFIYNERAVKKYNGVYMRYMADD